MHEAHINDPSTLSYSSPSLSTPIRTTGFEVGESPASPGQPRYTDKRPRDIYTGANSFSPSSYTSFRSPSSSYTLDNYEGTFIDPAMLSQLRTQSESNINAANDPGQQSGTARGHRRGTGFNQKSMELISESLMDMVHGTEVKQEAASTTPRSATMPTTAHSHTSSGSSGNYTPYAASESMPWSINAQSDSSGRPLGHRSTVSYTSPRSIPDPNFSALSQSPRNVMLPPSINPTGGYSIPSSSFTHGRSFSTPAYQAMLSPSPSNPLSWENPNNQESLLLPSESFDSTVSSLFGSPNTTHGFSLGSATASPGSTRAGRTRAYVEDQETGGRAGSAVDKKKRRREAHNLVERRRRDGINTAIQQLSELLPDQMLEPTTNAGATHHHAHLGTSSGEASTPQSRARSESILSPASPESNSLGIHLKPNKGVVLSRTVDYVVHLKQMVEMQAQRNAELTKAMRDLGVDAPLEQQDTRSEHDRYGQRDTLLDDTQMEC